MRVWSLWLLVTCAASSTLQVAAQDSASAPISSDPGYFEGPFVSHASGWTASDEAWYRRNRRIASAGKILTVLGLATTFAVGVPRSANNVIATGIALQFAGQLTWTGADLRGANVLSRRGKRVTRLPGIVAVCGAVLFSPIAWIAGPIQSARIRQAHHAAVGMSAPPPSGRYQLVAQFRF